MNALIALAVWCQPHGPATVLITQHRRPNGSSYSALRNGSSSNKDGAANNMRNINTSASTSTSKDAITSTNTNANSNDTPCPFSEPPNKPSAQHGSTPSDDRASTAPPSKGPASNSTSHSSLDTQAATTTATATPTTTTVTSSSTSSSSSSSSNPPSLESKKSRRSLHQPSPSEPSPSPVGSRPASAHPALSSNSCECQFSVPSGENSIHSVDPVNSELSYISQPVPVDTSLFAPIRVACIRALSSETYCGREGSVFFGDGLNGYVLSYMFTVHDAQSRGHRVKYTIMTMMTDRVYLVASMEYLISQFQAIASNLQSMAYTISLQQQSPAARSLSYSSSHHRGSIMPDNAPTRRGRPLTDVLAKPDIFIHLHAAFVSVLSNCSRRLTERHVQGRPINEFALQEQKQEQQSSGTDDTITIDSLRELRRVLGRKQFDKLVWNSAVGNQIIVRGEESRIVHEIIKALEDVLPKDCRTVIMDGSSYEPSYQCNILGLDRSIPIPPDLDPNDFILLDICLASFGHQIPTPPASFPANPHRRIGSGTTPPIYQADWSSATLEVDMKDLSIKMEKSVVEDTKSSNNEADKTQAAPVSSPGVLYQPGKGFQAQRRTYLLQAGEKPPDELQPNSGEINGRDPIGRRAMTPLNQPCPLYMETINAILNYNLPRRIEAKRLAVLRDEWISKSIQFHNLYKVGKASDEAVVHGFLQTMRVDKRDLKILRFFTRCAKSFQSQKYRSEDPLAAVASRNGI